MKALLLVIFLPCIFSEERSPTTVSGVNEFHVAAIRKAPLRSRRDPGVKHACIAIGEASAGMIRK